MAASWWRLARVASDYGVLGRANAAFHVGAGGASILGALAGGFLGQALGAREALFIAVGGISLAVATTFASPLPRLREIATEGELG